MSWKVPSRVPRDETNYEYAKSSGNVGDFFWLLRALSSQETVAVRQCLDLRTSSLQMKPAQSRGGSKNQHLPETMSDGASASSSCMAASGDDSISNGGQQWTLVRMGKLTSDRHLARGVYEDVKPFYEVMSACHGVEIVRALRDGDSGTHVRSELRNIPNGQQRI